VLGQEDAAFFARHYDAAAEGQSILARADEVIE
jgi:hypothetical protein